MPNGHPPDDPRWHRLLSLAVHEFRTPVTVVAGYARMLLSERAGPLTDQQRHMLKESEKSTARLSALIAEMSELAGLEAGTASFNRSAVDFGAIVSDATDALPPLPDREVTVTFENQAGGATVQGDPVRLRVAVSSVLTALRRELVTSTRLLARLRRESHDGRRALRLSIAGDEHIDRVDQARLADLGRFDEWRGGCGLSLAVARRIVAAQDGQLWSPAADPKAGAVLFLPEA